MNAYKKNQYLKYQIISTDDEDIDTLELPEEHINKPILEPIPALIEYVKDKYLIDVSEEVKNYESKINREENA
jgi:hypothetical protein